MVPNSNLQVPIPQNLLFARFGVDTVFPLAKNCPKALPKSFKNETFYPITFHRLDFLKTFQDVDASAINIKLILLTMTNLVHVPWGLFSA